MIHLPNELYFIIIKYMDFQDAINLFITNKQHYGIYSNENKINLHKYVIYKDDNTKVIEFENKIKSINPSLLNIIDYFGTYIIDSFIRGTDNSIYILVNDRDAFNEFSYNMCKICISGYYNKTEQHYKFNTIDKDGIWSKWFVSVIVRNFEFQDLIDSSEMTYHNRCILECHKPDIRKHGIYYPKSDYYKEQLNNPKYRQSLYDSYDEYNSSNLESSDDIGYNYRDDI